MSIFIINSRRSPITSFLSTNKKNLVDDSVNIVNDLCKTINKEDINRAYIGNVLSAGYGQNISRQITYNSKINCPSFVVNNVCGSGMISIIESVKSIQCKETNLALCGGVEYMSLAPYLNYDIRKQTKFGNTQLIDSLINDGLTDFVSKKHMGLLTEELIEKYDITKKDLDEYSILSYQRARENVSNLQREIFPLLDKNNLIDTDEEIFKNNDLNKIYNLRPAFKKDGKLSAGNSSKLSDGLSFMLVASEDYIKNNNIKPLVEIVDYDVIVGEPSEFSILPLKSIELICKKNKINIDDIDLFEVNEAFSHIPILCNKLLNIPIEKINIYGGAISLGHPLGCSGNRIVVTLINQLVSNNKKYGIASICNGGGGATTILLKNINFNI